MTLLYGFRLNSLPRFLGVFVTLVSLFAITGWANSDYGLIKEIKVYGNKKIEKDAILAKIKLKSGQHALSEGVAQDVRSVHSLGYFDDVIVDYTDGVLTYTVKERPTIASVGFSGNEQVSESDLKDVIKVKSYSILDINKVKEDVALIQKHYEDKGYYLARVSYEVVPDKEKSDEVKLVYKISDFDKVKIKKVTFINNKRFSDEKLKSLLRNTKEGSFVSWLTSSGSFKENAFKQDLQILTYFYMTEGYIKFHFENPVVTVSDDKKWLYISIYVDEGEQYSLAETDFEGDLLYSKEQLQEPLTLKKGQVFSIQKRNDDIQKLTEMYQDLGYAFANVNPKMEVHEEERTVDIRYEFEKGKLVHFGEVNIVGNSKTRDKVIRRELRFHEGELYHGTRFRMSRERVERLGYFSPGEVVFNTNLAPGKDDVLDVEVSVKERSTGTVTVGMGYGSVQKFFLTAQIGEINLFGRGQNLTLQGQYSQDRRSRSLDLGFFEPYLFDTTWRAGANAFFTSYIIPGLYLMYKKGLNTRIGKPLNDEINAYLIYKIEDSSPGEVVVDQKFIDPDIGLLSSVGFTIERDVRNNRFETSKGDHEALNFEFAGVGGRKFFAKATSFARYYQPVVGDLVFRSSFELGHVFQTTTRAIPPSERFFLGGPNSLKGYRQFSVTPRGVNDRPEGGVSQVLGIVEFEYPLIKEAGLKFVVFGDIGNTYRSWDALVRFDEGIKKDVGFGFRWFSPIGPLRFEWGFPIDRKNGEEKTNFQFFIGQPF